MEAPLPKRDRDTIPHAAPPRRRRRWLALLCGMLIASPAAAQVEFRAMTPGVEAAARTASDARMEQIVRREHAACVTGARARGDAKAFECNGVLVFAFGEARRRGLRALSDWAVQGVLASVYDPIDAPTALARLRAAAGILSSADYPTSLPFHAAYVADTLAAPAAGAAALADLVAQADRYEQLGYPASILIHAEGAATLARRIEGADSALGWRMQAQALRAAALLGRASALQRCSVDPAGPGADPATRLHLQVSCAIATEQAGRWREAEARLRALLADAQAQPAPEVRADVLVALGRNLIRQELYDAAVPFLTSARDLLAPLVTAEDERLLRAPAIRAARAQGALNIATGFRDGKPSGVHRALTGIDALEATIAAADTWALAAERLQRDIDRGALQWEGGVWRQLLTAYREAHEEAGRLIGKDAPMVAMLRAKDAQGQEQYLTEGFRRPLARDYIEEDLIRLMQQAVAGLVTLPQGDRHRVEGLAVAAGFLARNDRDVPRARSLCRSAMAGAIERLEAHAEFDTAAQAQLRRRAPLFAQCVGIAWQAGAAPGTAR